MTKKKVVIINDTSRFHAGTELIWYNLRRLCELSNFELIQCWETKHIINMESDIRHKIQDDIDMVIINGEGSLHHKTPMLKILERLSGIKPTILINTSWQYNGDQSKFLDQLQFISVREIYSWRDLVKHHLNKDPRIVGDLSLYSTEDLILRPWLNKTTGWQDSVVGKITRSFNEKPNYYPMRQVYQKPNLRDTIKWLGGVDFLITGRFHGVCLAMMLKIPFITFSSNTHKIEGMLEDAGCSELLMDSLNFNYDQMKELAEKKVESNFKYVLQVRKDIENMFKVIKEIK